MNCPCDELVFPRSLVIPAGLTNLPRQIATFPEFRAALLSAIGTKSPLRDWRARSEDDFGVMLLEMWAYVCDSISFYDEVVAHEQYLATARLRPSVRKLVGLLGYVPVPATAGFVELAAIAEGRKPVLLPVGAAFRSGAFNGNPPQVFETTAEHTIHPFFNEWKLKPTRPSTISGEWSHLLLSTSNLSAKKDDVLLLTKPNGPTLVTIQSLETHTGKDLEVYKKATLTRPVQFGSNASLSAVRLWKPVSQASVWQSPTDSDPGITWSSFLKKQGARLRVRLDSIYRQIRKGHIVLLRKGDECRWFNVVDVFLGRVQIAAATTTTITDADGNKTTVEAPAVHTYVTHLTLDASLTTNARSSIAGAAAWSTDDADEITVHFGMTEAATVTREANTTLDKNSPLLVEGVLELPASPAHPSVFQLEDRNTDGLQITGTLDFTNGVLALDQTAKWESPLTVPVTMYGNVVPASHGETVNGEFLGTGNGSVANQTFKLKKSPLTYLAAGASTLRVYVAGVLWTEAPSLFGKAATDQVYIVRQDDDANSILTFGDGTRGSRLPSGAAVVAYYRFGAGAASPPAGSITQIAKSVVGLRSVRNPVAAVSGSDAEVAENIRTYGPRSALLLGRAVSVQDFEAAAATQGVRAVSAEWRWNKLRQRPVVQVWYIGDEGKEQSIAQALRALADPATPIVVEVADAVPRTLSLDIEVDPKYLADDVKAGVRTALTNSDTGLLSPERVGIGRPLYRSAIFESALRVPGATAVRGASLGAFPFLAYAVTPGAGRYFDFETGGLVLNG